MHPITRRTRQMAAFAAAWCREGRTMRVYLGGFAFLALLCLGAFFLLVAPADVSGKDTKLARFEWIATNSAPKAYPVRLLRAERDTYRGRSRKAASGEPECDLVFLCRDSAPWRGVRTPTFGKVQI